jgi:hypothetical protein
MRTLNDLLLNSEYAQTTNGSIQDMGHVFGYSATSVVTVTTPTAKTFVDANVTPAADTIAITAHGFKVGLVGRLTTTGVLPAGLALVTDYYVIVVDANTIKLASSLVNANAGTAVDITAAAGGGTHTFTATAIAGGTLTWQGCNDPLGLTTDTWVTLSTPASQALTVTATYLVRDTDTHYKWLRPVLTLTSGQVTIATRINGKGV